MRVIRSPIALQTARVLITYTLKGYSPPAPPAKRRENSSPSAAPAPPGGKTLQILEPQRTAGPATWQNADKAALGPAAA